MWFAWFIYGIVWVVTADGCPTAPLLFRLSVALTSIHGFILCCMSCSCCFYTCRVLVEISQNASEIEYGEGATLEDIEQLPVISFPAEVIQESSCPICLELYVDGDQLRLLPCKHYFHQACADPWFQRQKECPLCKHPITQILAESTTQV